MICPLHIKNICLLTNRIQTDIKDTSDIFSTSVKTQQIQPHLFKHYFSNILNAILMLWQFLELSIHLSGCLFLYFNYLVSVTAGGPESPRGHRCHSGSASVLLYFTCSQVLRPTSVGS